MHRYLHGILTSVIYSEFKYCNDPDYDIGFIGSYYDADFMAMIMIADFMAG